MPVPPSELPDCRWWWSRRFELAVEEWKGWFRLAMPLRPALVACAAGPPELKVAPEVEFAVYYVLLNFMSTKPLPPPCKFWGSEHVVVLVPLFSFELACRLQAASPPVTMWCLAPPDSCLPPAVCCASAKLPEATTSISGLFCYCWMNCCYRDMLPLVATTLRGCAPPAG